MSGKKIIKGIACNRGCLFGGSSGLFWSCFAFFAASFLPFQVNAQITSPCTSVGLGQPINTTNQTELISACAPAVHKITYGLKYLSAPRPGHTFEMVFDWGDGVDRVAVNEADLTSVNGAEVVQQHTYSSGGSCAYTVIVSMYVDSQECTETQRTVTLPNWTPDNLNGGQVRINGAGRTSDNLIVPVCQGQPISLALIDATILSCQSGLRPNDLGRWYEVVYNTGQGQKVPNVSVNGTQLTDAQGQDVKSDFSNGVIHLPAPVNNSFNRASILPITAPGGFGANASQFGDEFEVTLRYWNTCNPYDLSTGASNAIEATATIQIVESPNPPVLTDTLFCAFNSYSTYTVRASAVLAGSPYYRWFLRDASGTLQKQEGFSSSFNPLNYNNALQQASIYNGNGGSIEVLATASGSVSGNTQSCTSDTTAVTFTVLPRLDGKYLSIGGSTVSHTICSGVDPLAFVAPAATGGNDSYVYQWQKSTDGFNYSDIAGATAETFDEGPLTTTTWYRRRVRSAKNQNIKGGNSNCKEAYSARFTIIVERPVTAGKVGVAQTICLGGTSTGRLTSIIYPTNGNGVYDYQWESTTDDPVTNSNPTINIEANSNGATLLPPADLAQTTWYRRSVKSGVCSTGASTWSATDWVKITVNSTISAGTVEISGGQTTATICAGVTPSQLVEASAPSGGANYTYQWRSSSTQGGPYNIISSATNGTSYSPSQLADTTYFVRTVSASVCSTNSNEIMIAVNPLPRAQILGGGAICSSVAPSPDVVINVYDGAAPWTIVYSKDGVNQPAVTIGKIGDTQGEHRMSSPDAGSYTLVSVTDRVSCSAVTLTGTATVNNSSSQVPTISSLTATSPVCDAGSATNPPDAIITFSPAGSKNYRVAYSFWGTPRSPFTRISSVSGEITIDPVYALWGNRPATHTLEITEVVDISTGCKVSLPATTTIDLKVDSVPVITSQQSKTICSRDVINYKILMTGAPESITRFRWSKGGISQDEPATSAIHIADRLINSLNSSTTSEIYSVTPFTSSCTGSPQDITIYVNPEPVIVPSQRSEVCEGVVINHAIKMNNAPLNTQVSWRNPVTGILSTVLQRNAPTLINALPNNTADKGDTTFYYRVTAQSGAGCTSLQDSIEVVVHPVPELSSNNVDRDICPGDPVNYYIALDPPGAPVNTSFSWSDPTSGSPVTIKAGAIGTLHIRDIYNTPGIRNYTIRATSDKGCSSSPQIIGVNVNTPPTLADITNFVCETLIPGQDNGTGSGVVDLTTLESSVGKGATDNTRWYADYDPNTGVLSTEIASGSATGETQNYAVNQNESVYVEITRSTGAQCATVATVDLIYQPVPVSGDISYTGSGVRSPSGDVNICMDDAQSHIFQISPANTPPGQAVQRTYIWNYPALISQLLPGGDDTGHTITLQFSVRPTASKDTISVTESHNGCAGAAKKIVINTESTAARSVISGNSIVCAENTNITYSVSGSPASALYTWTLPTGVSFVANTVQTGKSVSLNFPSQLTAPRSDVEIEVKVETGSAKCVADPAQPFNVAIIQNPMMTSPGDAVICSGNSVSSGVQLASQGGPPGTTYNWQVSNITGGVSNVVVGDSKSGDTTLGGSALLLNRSGSAGSVVYRVTPVGPNRQNAGNSCKGGEQNVTISVNPEPVVMPSQRATVCSDKQIDYEILLSPANLPAQTVFNWPAPVPPVTLAGSNVLADVAGTPHIKDIIENRGVVAATYTYQITPNDGQTNPTCTGNAEDVVITVNPEPVGSDDTIAICSGVQLSYDLQDNINNVSPSGTGLPTSFSWFAADNPNVTGETLLNAASTRGIVNDQLINYTSTEQVVMYTVVPTNKLSQLSPSCQGDAFTIRVTVRPEPVGMDDNVVICSGVALEYDLQNNIGGGVTGGLRSGITYTWVTSLNSDLTVLAAGVGTSQVDDVITNVTIADQQITYTVTPTYTDVSNNRCVGADFDVLVTVSPEPRGATFNSTICSQNTPNINLQNVINASGNKLTSTFVWAGSPNADVTGISPSSTSAIIADVLVNVTGSPEDVVYSVTPSALSAGGLTCTGEIFSVTVTANPEPVGVAVSDLTICSGQDPQYDLQQENIDNPSAGNKVPSTFTWSASSNTNVMGEQTTTQSTSAISGRLDNTTNAPSRVAYMVTPTSRLGSCVGSSFQVGIVVDPEPVGFNVQQTICGGVALSYDIQPANIDATGSGGNGLPSTFVWKASSNTNVSGLSTSEQHTPIINDQIANQGSRSQSVTYTITPTSSVGMCRGKDFEFSVIVNPQPQSVLSTQTICSDDAVNRNLASNITNSLSSTYVWQATDNVNVTGESTSNQSVGIINDILKNTTGISQQVVYTVVPTGAANNCLGDSFTISVNVNPEPVGAGAVSAVCSNAQLSYDLQENIDDNNGVTSTFRWRSRTSVIGVSGESTVEQSTSSIRDNLTNITNADIDVLYDIFPTSTDNCVGSMFTLTLTVYPKPNANDATGLDVCSGDALNYDLADHLTNSGNGLTANTVYEWSTLVSGNVSGASVSVRRAPTIDDVLSLNAGVIANQSLNYTVTPIDQTNGCEGNAFSVEVVVKPKPIGIDETVPLCSDLHLNFDLLDNIRKGNSFTTNTTYEWLPIDNPGVTGESVGSPRSGNLIDDRLLNITDVVQDVMYFYVPANSNGCKGDTVYITVDLSPSPILDPTLATKSICSRSTGNTNAVGITLNTVANSIPATGYNITSSLGVTPGFSGAPTQGSNLRANAISTDSYKNLTTSTVDVIYTVVPVSSGSCLGTPVDIVVTVYPEPVVNPNLDASVCSGLASGITLSTNGTSVAAASYTLKKLTVPVLPDFTADPANIMVGDSKGNDLISQEQYVNVTPANVSADYQIRAVSAPSGNLGGCVGEPEDITLTIKPQPVFNSAIAATVCSGFPSAVTLSTAASSVVATAYNINGITRSSASLVVGTNNASISFGQPADILSKDVFFNNTAGALTVTYKIAPVSAEQCMGAEDDLMLTINPAPALANDLDATVCSNEISGILLNAASGVAATLYDVIRIDVAPGLVAAAGNATPTAGIINSAIRGDQFENPNDVPLDVTYTVLGESANRCKGSQGNIVLTVEPTVKATPVANITTICSGSSIDIELDSPTKPTSGSITFEYMVTSASGQVTGFVGSQASLPMGYKIESTLNNSSDSPNTVTYAITAVANAAKDGDGCIALTAVPVEVTIEPLPKLIPTPTGQVVCEGVPTAIELTTTTSPSVGGINFEVISTTPTGGLTLSSPSPPPSVYLPGTSIGDTWNNPTLDYQNVGYVLRANMDDGLGCQGAEVLIEVGVRPDPELTPVDPLSVCSGMSLRIPLTMDLSGAYATWDAAAPVAIAGVANGGGNRIDVRPINTALTPEIITYLVTPKIGICSGDPITVEVRVDPAPNTVGLPANKVVCDGEILDVPLSSGVPGATTFDWTVLDSYGLGAPSAFDGSGTTINQQLDNPLGYKAVLVYTVIPTSAFSCVGEPSFMNVEVVSILPEITPNRTQICSGDRVRVVNTSLGALSHRWFYRQQGTNDEFTITTNPSADYLLKNNTSQNPIYYEIVYEASNGSCSRPQLATPPIVVYRSVTAGFDEGTIPPIKAGISEVTFTNTSDPIEDSQFRYEWNFGVNSHPIQYVGSSPPTVTYNGQGFRDVRLRAINNDSEAVGLSCEDELMKTIVIPVLPLMADFVVNQPKSCVPVKIAIENLSTGDDSQWRVLDENGIQVATSNQHAPIFTMTVSGDYTVFLTTRDSFTGQVEVTSKKFSVYEQPTASFLARPPTVFVPNDEVAITNLSEDANTYLWDFGDGDSSTEEHPSGHRYNAEGAYDLQLIAGRDYGNGVICRDTLTRRITAQTGGEIMIPDTFTPGPAAPGSGSGGTSTSPSEGINDVFLPIVKGVRSFNMQIYDRWGNLLFESSNATVGWDGRNSKGKFMPAGVYVYRLEIQLSDGNKTTKIGDITMLR